MFSFNAPDLDEYDPRAYDGWCERCGTFFYTHPDDPPVGDTEERLCETCRLEPYITQTLEVA